MNKTNITDKIFDTLFLGLCICILALRTTYTEVINIPDFALSSFGLEDIYSLSLSGLLIAASAVWLITKAFRKNFVYRFSGIEIGLLVFTTAAVIGIINASNKRAAITDFTTIAAPVLMAAVAIQTLRNDSQRKIILLAITALAMVGFFQSAEQFFSSNQILIEEYQKDPNLHLQNLNIEPGSLNQMLYEHRLHSKDVRGFFTTGNSAGCFAILGLFTAAAWLAPTITRFAKDKKQNIKSLLTIGSACLLLAAAVIITKSKGALASAIAAAILFALYLKYRPVILKHKKKIFTAAIVLIAASAAAIILYGLKHHRLPGGNSMLVRWQYWTAAFNIWLDYPIFGTGGGNFAAVYPAYKIPAALETVKDPHNIILSFLSQYGLLGTVGFFTAIAIPLFKIFFRNNATQHENNEKPLTGWSIFLFALIATVSLLIVRPIILDAPLGSRPNVRIYLAVMLYVLPAMIFFLTFIITGTNIQVLKINSTSVALLIFAAFAALLHNLIDFAIFEPGINTAFWAILAVIISKNKTTEIKLTARPLAAFGLAATAVLVFAAFLYFAYIPPARANTKTRRADTLAKAGRLTAELLKNAQKADPYSTMSPLYNAQLLIENYRQTSDIQKLLKAEKLLLTAAQTDPKNFKTYSKLTDAYLILAKHNSEWLEKAYQSSQKAVELYPGSAKLRIAAAQIAERTDNTETAVMHYTKAVEIEDAFTEQFKNMYPGTDIVSRLGKANYALAKNRLTHLKTIED